MDQLSGKTAIVVGASSGMGRAIAVGFAQEGANIIGLARNLEALEGLAEEVRGYGREAHVKRFDVMEPNAYPELVKWLDENQLDFDIIVHMVGGATFALAEKDERLQGLFKEYKGKLPFWVLSDDDVDRVLTLGVKSCMSTCRYLLPRLMEKKAGALIVIGSGAGKAGVPQRYADYSAEKGAVMAYVPAIAHELKPYNISANILLPGYTASRRVPDPNAAQPEDCVPAAIHLAQQDASFTGQWFDAQAYKKSLVN